MSWTLNAAGLGPDPTVEISARPVPLEPMVGLLTASYTPVPHLMRSGST